jgi:pimeloyl-ACP methyl ester carboxylesterase
MQLHFTTPVATLRAYFQPDRRKLVATIDLGGRRFAFSQSGVGSPTVVLETGLGAEAAEWSGVQQTVARCSCVLSYDRAGRGASDEAAPGRPASALVEDLKWLLQLAEVPAPYLLVGHSFGGLLVRLYAHRYPQDVAGIVLVDSLHEDQFDVFGERFPPRAPGEPAALAQQRAFWTGGWRRTDSTAEGIDLPASLAEGRQVRCLGSIPLHVIAAGAFFHNPLVPTERRAELQRSWERLQRGLLRLSADSHYTLVADSGHFVQREYPEVVSRAIEAMLSQLRETQVRRAV